DRLRESPRRLEVERVAAVLNGVSVPLRAPVLAVPLVPVVEAVRAAVLEAANERGPVRVAEPERRRAALHAGELEARSHAGQPVFRCVGPVLASELSRVDHTGMRFASERSGTRNQPIDVHGTIAAQQFTDLREARAGDSVCDMVRHRYS